jgi:hypothetical protein
MQQLFLSCLIVLWPWISQSAGLADRVNPLLGTDSKHSFFPRQHLSRCGHSFCHDVLDAANRRTGDGWIYTYQQPSINAFKATHHPALDGRLW